MGLALLLWVSGIVWFHYQVRHFDGRTLEQDRAADAGYSLGDGAWLKARLYHRQDHRYIGRITSLDCPHPGPSDVPRCVEVEYQNGLREWLSREVVAQDFVIVSGDSASP